MSLFAWQQQSAELLSGKAGDLLVECYPLKGLLIQAGKSQYGPVLGLEVVDAENLGPQPLASVQSPPEVVVRQDMVQVQYAPTTKRPVECQARWRVLPEGIFDLEVSTLTPGKWDGLAVQTCSRFTLSDKNEVTIDQSVSPGIVLVRPASSQLTYVEFCHPDAGIQVDLQVDGSQALTRYRLFGHDLEKGVILRGRLRGILVPRATDLAAARSAYARFLTETPNLT